MGKVTKRARKFNAKGGVKTALEKGTVAKKGKLRKRSKKSQSSNPSEETKEKVKDNVPSDDFSGKENLGSLEMDEFFAMATGELKEEESDEESSGEEEKFAQMEKEDDDDDDGSSDSGDDDNEEDIEAAEERMKEEMAKIQETDPEFHEFLKENEESLLEFGDEEDEAKPEDETAEEQEPQAEDERSVKLTVKTLKSMYQGAFRSHGVKSLKKLIGAYHSACHMADAAESGPATRGGRAYVIESSKVFDQLMLTTLNRCHEEFRYHLGLAPEDDDAADADEALADKPIQPHKMEKSSKWADLRPIMQSFFRSTLHLIGEAKEPQLLVVVLKALSNYIPFLSSLEHIREKMLKALTALWSAPLDSSEDYQIVRLNAFFRIRQLALTQPFPFIETCLKKTYLAYARRARFGNSPVMASMSTLTFLGNCLVELYSLDFQSSYQHAFVYIRQLALLLRGALQKKTPEAFQQVFCWQYVNCLKLWTAVLAEAVPNEDATLMRSLVFPLTEIVQGVCRLAPSPVRFVPLRFHCVRLLQQLAAASSSFAPTSAILLETLDWKEWYLSPKKVKGGAAVQPLQMLYLVKLGKTDALRTTEQLEPAISELFLLLQREIDLYRYSAGFPEFCVRIIQRLKSFTKETRVARWRAYAKNCIDTCEKHRSSAIQERTKLQDAPKDVSTLECLRSPSAPSMLDRYRATVEKESKALQNNLQPKPFSGEKRQREDADGPEASNNKESKSAKKRRKKREAAERNKAKLLEQSNSEGKGSLELADEVQEGVDWSDEE